MADADGLLVADVLSGALRLLDIRADMQASGEAIYDDVDLWLGDHLDKDDPWDVYAQSSMRFATDGGPGARHVYLPADCDRRAA